MRETGSFPFISCQMCAFDTSKDVIMMKFCGFGAEIAWETTERACRNSQSPFPFTEEMKWADRQLHFMSSLLEWSLSALALRFFKAFIYCPLPRSTEWRLKSVNVESTSWVFGRNRNPIIVQMSFCSYYAYSRLGLQCWTWTLSFRRISSNSPSNLFQPRNQLHNWIYS